MKGIRFILIISSAVLRNKRQWQYVDCFLIYLFFFPRFPCHKHPRKMLLRAFVKRGWEEKSGLEAEGKLRTRTLPAAASIMRQFIDASRRDSFGLFNSGTETVSLLVDPAAK